ASALCQLAGLPMRIAVATVRGSSITRLCTIGAAPAASKPIMRGRWVILPAARYSLYPRQYAVMLPALPTGNRWYSGARPSTSQLSYAGFCLKKKRTAPSSRAGLDAGDAAVTPARELLLDP